MKETIPDSLKKDFFTFERQIQNYFGFGDLLVSKTIAPFA